MKHIIILQCLLFGIQTLSIGVRIEMESFGFWFVFNIFAGLFHLFFIWRILND